MTSSSDLDGIIELAHLAGRLKALKRSGWVRKAGIRDAESVADHTFRLALLTALMARRRGLDVEKATIMALIHDLPEAIIGDLTPEDPGSSDKAGLEGEAFRELIAGMPPDLGAWLLDIWLDYSRGESEEAMLVRDLDRLEMALQAFEYARDHDPGALREFHRSALECVRDPEVYEACKALEP